jgi:ribosomal protein L24
MNLDEVNNLWYNSQPIEGIAFRLNDSVLIKSGDYSGQSGSVISIVSVETTPIYLIELGNTGEDVQVKQSELEII